MPFICAVLKGRRHGQCNKRQGHCILRTGPDFLSVLVPLQLNSGVSQIDHQADLSTFVHLVSWIQLLCKSFWQNKNKVTKKVAMLKWSLILTHIKNTDLFTFGFLLLLVGLLQSLQQTPQICDAIHKGDLLILIWTGVLQDLPHVHLRSVILLFRLPDGAVYEGTMWGNKSWVWCLQRVLRNYSLSCTTEKCPTGSQRRRFTCFSLNNVFLIECAERSSGHVTQRDGHGELSTCVLTLALESYVNGDRVAALLIQKHIGVLWCIYNLLWVNYVHIF